MLSAVELAAAIETANASLAALVQQQAEAADREAREAADREAREAVRATLRRGHSYTKILRDRGEPNRRDTLTQW